MATKEIRVSFKLEDKKLNDGKTFKGLSELWLNEGAHLREVLLMIEAIASPLPVIGFTDVRTQGVYESCDWYTTNYQNRVLVASSPIDVSKLGSEVW